MNEDLHSATLQFSGDGKLIVCAGANGVVLVGVEPGAAPSAPTHIAQPGVTAIAAFPEQVWTLDGNRAELARFDRGGRALGSPHRLATAPCAPWTVVPTGAPAVLVRGTAPRVVAARDDELVELGVHGRGLVVPLATHRYVTCHDHVVWFGRGVSARLASGIAALGGAAVFGDERLLLLVADARGARGAILFATETGRVQRQLELPRGEARVAARRGVIVVRTSARGFEIADVRSGKLLAPWEARSEVDDFAVDPLARRIAIRAGGTVSIHGLLGLPSLRPEIEIPIGTARSDASGAPAAVAALPIVLADRLAARREVDARKAAPPRLARISLAVGASLDAMPRAADVRLGSTTPPATPPPHLPALGTHPSSSPASERACGEARALPDPPRAGPPDTNAAAEETPILDLFKLRGFGPPPERPLVTPHEAARLLQGELRWIELRTALAIARHWDTGRIAYANESRFPQELEVMSVLAGNPGGHARDHVEAIGVELIQHEQALASDSTRRTDATPLGALAAELRLSPLATTILLVVAGPLLRGELGRHYAILANDAARAHVVDELLVQQILVDTPEDRNDIARELAPSAPLCRYGLVHAGEGRPRPHAPLVVDPMVVARLCGEPLAFGPDAALSVRAADRALHELFVPSALVLDAMRYLARAAGDDHPARIAVRGPSGCGRRALLAALAHKAGRELGLVDLKRLPRQPELFATALRTELRRARLAGLIPCLTRLDEAGAGSADPLRDAVQDVVRTHPGPVAVHLASGARVPLDAGYLRLDLPPPTEPQRLEIWSDELAAHGLSVDAARVLAARYRVGPGTIRSAARAVAEARAAQGRLAGDVLADIETHLRQGREVKLGDHARRIERRATWSSLVLPDDTLSSLRELIGRARHRRTVFDEWGFDGVLATARGLTALFEGAPGTGKTLAAGVIARELGLDLYQVDLSKITSKWIGETEKNLGAIFDAAEEGQALLLFDEADSLFAKRSEVRSSNDRFANMEVNFLLQRLDAFEGFAILTSNFGASIDPAFKRRLSFRLTLPFPDEDLRARLWRAHLPPSLPVAGRLDLEALAHEYKLSGGYIRNACVRAAFLAAEGGTPLAQAHLVQAVRLEYADAGKLSPGGRME